MCKPISGIILKDRILFSELSTSHTDILLEQKIEDTKENAERLFVRAELYPADGDMFSDINNWIFNVDQDIIPEWFVIDYEKARMIEAVKEYAKEHIFVNTDDLEIKNKIVWLKNCKNSSIYGNSTSKHCGNSTSKHYSNSKSTHYDNSTSEHYDNSTSEHYGNSTSTHFENSTSIHYGNSTSTHFNNSTSIHYGNSTSIIPFHSSAKNEQILLFGDSTLKNCFTKTIYQSGDWKLVSVNNLKCGDENDKH